MDHLGVKPGRVVGEALDFLLEVRLDEGPISEDEAYARLDAWAREQGIEPAAATYERPCGSGAFLAGAPDDRRRARRGAGSARAGSGSSDGVDAEARRGRAR